MNTLPIVSIVIPNYNYARFLDARFDSILAQTGAELEIIFLDDASQDSSVELVRGHYGQHVERFEVNAENSGNPFKQWNLGARLARGKYLWIAEADDTCAPAFLGTMLGALESAPSIGMAYCTTVPIDTEGAPLDVGFHQRYLEDLDTDRWKQDFVATGRDEVRKYLRRKNTITNVSGVLFRREAYVKSGYAPEHLRMCGDWMTYCRLLLNWDVAFFSAPLNFHRQHPTKHTQNSVLDLSYFREFLQVQAFVAEAFKLEDSQKEDAFRRFLAEWDRLTVSNYGRLSVRSNFRIGAMATAQYSRPAQLAEIVQHLSANISRSMGAK